MCLESVVTGLYHAFPAEEENINTNPNPPTGEEIKQAFEEKTLEIPWMWKFYSWTLATGYKSSTQVSEKILKPLLEKSGVVKLRLKTGK